MTTIISNNFTTRIWENAGKRVIFMALHDPDFGAHYNVVGTVSGTDYDGKDAMAAARILKFALKNLMGA